MKTEALAQHILDSVQGRKRYITAIAGPPGAGKSTLAQDLLEALTKQAAKARIVSMDGFHLDNSILAQRDLLTRKGAPETFDARGFVHLLERLSNLEPEVAIPTFDRVRDISVAGADIVSQNDTILIVEGNYLFLKHAPWAGLQKFWDETIFINPGIDILEKRLVDRWLQHGLSANAAKIRALSNDIPNAHYVLEHSAKANIHI